MGVAPVAIRNVVVSNQWSSSAFLLARRPELLHRQPRGGDGLLPSGAGDHAEHQGSGGRRASRRREGPGPSAERRRDVELLLRAGVDVDPAASSRRGQPLRAQARLHLQLAPRRPAPQLSLLRVRRRHDAALLRHRPVAAHPARPRGPGVLRAAGASPPRLSDLAGVRPRLRARRRGVLRRRTLSAAAPRAPVHRHGRGDRRLRCEHSHHAGRRRSRRRRSSSPSCSCSRTGGCRCTTADGKKDCGWRSTS